MLATELPDGVTEPDVAPNLCELYERVAIPAESFANTVIFAISQPANVFIVAHQLAWPPYGVTLRSCAREHAGMRPVLGNALRMPSAA